MFSLIFFFSLFSWTTQSSYQESLEKVNAPIFSNRLENAFDSIRELELPYEDMVEAVKDEINQKLDTNIDASELGEVLIQAAGTSYAKEHNIPESTLDDIFEAVKDLNLNEINVGTRLPSLKRTTTEAVPIPNDAETITTAQAYERVVEPLKNYLAHHKQGYLYIGFHPQEKLFDGDFINRWVKYVNQKHPGLKEEHAVKSRIRNFLRFLQSDFNGKLTLVTSIIQFKKDLFTNTMDQFRHLIDLALRCDEITEEQNKELIRRFDQLVSALYPLFQSSHKDHKISEIRLSDEEHDRRPTPVHTEYLIPLENLKTNLKSKLSERTEKHKKDLEGAKLSKEQLLKSEEYLNRFRQFAQKADRSLEDAIRKVAGRII